MADHDISDALREQVADAVAQGTSLCISGGNSKAFYGHRTDRVNHHPLRVEEHRGITNYQPSELTLTARAGTPLADIRAELDAAGQMLPFDPPALDGVNGQVATLGGTLACGFSGPARPFAGSCRDYVLGTRIINGRAQSLRFGGEVMKNVAGYDLSRLMVGALGTFGVILDASLKVLPKPAVTRSFSAVCSPEEALDFLHEKRMAYLPLTGASFHDGQLHYRLAGAISAVSDCAEQFHNALGGTENDGVHWDALREHTLPFFDDSRPLWRLAVPPGTGVFGLADTATSESDDMLIDWGGQQRWLLSEAEPAAIQQRARQLGGHATRFQRGDESVFQDIQPAERQLHERLKAAFDPKGLFNPGRLATGLS